MPLSVDALLANGDVVDDDASDRDANANEPMNDDVVCDEIACQHRYRPSTTSMAGSCDHVSATLSFVW